MIIKRKLFDFPSHIDGKDKHGRFIIHTKDGKEVSPKIYYENDGRIILRDRETDEVIEKSYSKKEKDSRLHRLKLAAINAVQNGARIVRNNMKQPASLAQMAWDAHNQAIQDHMMHHINMHTFSNKIDEGE